jgi:hypothetical protein
MFVKSQLEYAQLHNLTAAPTPGVKGLIYHDTVLLRSYIDNGTVISAILANDQKCIFGTSGTANSNIRFNRAAAGVLQLVLGGDTTAEASLSTSLAQLSSRVENYTTGTLPAAANAGRLLWDTTLSALKVDTGAALLNAMPLTTKGDIYTYSTVPIRVAVGTDGQVLSADSAQATGVKWITPSTAPDQAYAINNHTLTCTVGSSALTIALKTKAGSDASASDKVSIAFRSATAATVPTPWWT